MAEDRPYRKGMGKEKVKKILNDLVQNKSIDTDIVSILIENYYELNDLRKSTQVNSIKKYRTFKDKIELIKKNNNKK